MNEKKEFTEEEIRFIMGGWTQEREDLRMAEKGLNDFITKYGGQYFGVVIWPTADSGVKEKYKVGSSNHVHILPSGQGVPFNRALSAVFEWLRMEQARRQK